MVAGTYSDVAFAVILALVFAVVVGLVFEDIKARLIRRELEPVLERTRTLREAMLRIGAPPRYFTTRLVLENGETVGGMTGMMSNHQAGAIIRYGSKWYEIVGMSDPELDQPDQTERTLTLRPHAAPS